MNAPWPTVPLGEVLQLSNRSVLSTNLEEVNLAGVYSFGRGLFKRGPMRPSETSYKSYNRLVPDDFIISQPKAWEGALARVSIDFEGWYLSPVFPCFSLNQQRLSPSYLEWYCKRRLVWQKLQLLSKGMGARRETVSPEQFLGLEIPLPPLDEQRRIEAWIDSLTVKLKEVITLHEEVSKELQALIVATHVTRSVATAKPLSEYIELHEDAVRVEADQAYPQVGVRGFGCGLFPKAAVAGSETTYRVFNRLYEGALVLSQVKGWEGAVAVTPSDLVGFFASPEYRTFRCRRDRCLPEYLAALVPTEYFWSRLKDATRGVGARRERTRPEQFLELKFPMPSIEDQKQALQTFAQIRDIQALQASSAPQLDALLPAIIEKAFSSLPVIA